MVHWVTLDVKFSSRSVIVITLVYWDMAEAVIPCTPCFSDPPIVVYIRYGVHM